MQGIGGRGAVEDELKDPQKSSLTENSELAVACSAAPPSDGCEDGPAGLCVVSHQIPRSALLHLVFRQKGSQ